MKQEVCVWLKNNTHVICSVRGSCLFKGSSTLPSCLHQSCYRDSLCCHGTPHFFFFNALHCAGPVAMVTALSDRWSSHRHGVLNSSTIPSLSTDLCCPGGVSPLVLTPSLALCPYALCPTACCRFIQKQITSLKGAFHLLLLLRSRRLEGRCSAGPALTTLWRTVCLPAEVGYSPEKTASHPLHVPWNLQQRDQLLANAVCVSAVTHRARRASVHKHAGT